LACARRAAPLDPLELVQGVTWRLHQRGDRRLTTWSPTTPGVAGLALIFPAWLRIRPWLTPLAAAGLVLLMLGAIIFHVGRKEYPNIGLNAVLGLLALVIVWGRFGPYHF
jgi:hypothetical protein